MSDCDMVDTGGVEDVVNADEFFLGSPGPVPQPPESETKTSGDVRAIRLMAARRGTNRLDITFEVVPQRFDLRCDGCIGPAHATQRRHTPPRLAMLTNQPVNSCLFPCRTINAVTAYAVGTISVSAGLFYLSQDRFGMLAEAFVFRP